MTVLQSLDKLETSYIKFMEKNDMEIQDTFGGKELNNAKNGVIKKIRSYL